VVFNSRRDTMRRSRLLGVVLGASVLVLIATAAWAAGTFTDDDGNTHEGNIEAIAAADITKGCNPPTNDLYCPGDPVTRAQMAAFLHRALPELPILYPEAGNFGDVWDPVIDEGPPPVFFKDIEWLAQTGITRGCNPPANTNFCPDDSVTRGQMAAFLVRALGYTDDGGGDLFTDDDGSTFESDIDKLATAGVTVGCNPPANTEFCPDEPVLRDQMASFLARALGLDPIPPPPDPTTTTTQPQCDPSYPDFCIPPPPPDLSCNDIPQKDFTVLPPDPHNFDGNQNGVGCES
jgi:hypothetical protein